MPLWVRPIQGREALTDQRCRRATRQTPRRGFRLFQPAASHIPTGGDGDGLGTGERAGDSDKLGAARERGVKRVTPHGPNPVTAQWNGSLGASRADNTVGRRLSNPGRQRPTPMAFPTSCPPRPSSPPCPLPSRLPIHDVTPAQQPSWQGTHMVWAGWMDSATGLQGGRWEACQGPESVHPPLTTRPKDPCGRPLTLRTLQSDVAGSEDVLDPRGVAVQPRIAPDAIPTRRNIQVPAEPAASGPRQDAGQKRAST